MRYLLAFTATFGLMLSGCAQQTGASFSPSSAAFASHSPGARALQPHATVVFRHTGTLADFTVPSGVTRVTIKASGARGSSGQLHSTPGSGAIVMGTFSVQPGEILFVEAGLHGGGAGGKARIHGSRGGNYSAVLHVRHDGSALVLIAAGGGGGAGGADQNTPGGHGGSAGKVGYNGGDRGGFHCPDCGGRGATQSAGGAAGTLPTNRALNGLPGAQAFGGDGGGASSDATYGGGGGGGGWFGGGGGTANFSSGGGSGGGGGSSYVEPSASNVTFESASTGDGEVTISW